MGSVDDDSPASQAGMKAGDRIVEVNGTNISNENHQQVVQRIKAVQNETKLLLVDRDTDNYYRARKIVIRGDMPNVQRIEGFASRSSPAEAAANHRDSEASGSLPPGRFYSVSSLCCMNLQKNAKNTSSRFFGVPARVFTQETRKGTPKSVDGLGIIQVRCARSFVCEDDPISMFSLGIY